MESVTKMFVCAREYVVRSARGQTMTEYTLVLAVRRRRGLWNLQSARQQRLMMSRVRI
jgi:hypothetical protein